MIKYLIGINLCQGFRYQLVLVLVTLACFVLVIQLISGRSADMRLLNNKLPDDPVFLTLLIKFNHRLCSAFIQFAERSNMENIFVILLLQGFVAGMFDGLRGIQFKWLINARMLFPRLVKPPQKGVGHLFVVVFGNILRVLFD